MATKKTSKKSPAKKSPAKKTPAKKAPAKKKSSAASISWPVKKTAEPKDAASARMTFDIMTGKGFKAHYVDGKGNPERPMKEFDETAGGMVFV